MARAETAKLQSGDEENLKLWNMFINASMIEFNGVYKRLGVAFDEVLGESAYNDQLPSVVSELQKLNIAQGSEGAVVVHALEVMEVVEFVRGAERQVPAAVAHAGVEGGHRGEGDVDRPVAAANERADGGGKDVGEVVDSPASSEEATVSLMI